MERFDNTTSEMELWLEARVQVRPGPGIRRLRVVSRTDGIILQGSANTYYAGQLAQQSVMEMTTLPVLANRIEVC